MIFADILAFQKLDHLTYMMNSWEFNEVCEVYRRTSSFSRNLSHVDLCQINCLTFEIDLLHIIS